MDNRQITVVLAEPSAIISAGFASVLANYNTFRIVERVSDLRFLPDVVARYSPEIIVVNPLLFDYKSKFSVRSIVSGTDGPALAALTSTLYDEMVFSQFDAVISIYDSPAAIIKSLRKAVDASKRGTSRLRNEDNDLSEREKEILVAVAKGKTNKEIADEFNISVYTVISHRKNISQKTGIKSIAGLTVYAMLNNMIDSDEL